MNLEFSQQNFEKKKTTQMSNSMQIRPVGAELFRADRQT